VDRSAALSEFDISRSTTLKHLAPSSVSASHAGTASIGRKGVAKLLFSCALGLAAASSYATTIDQVVSDMSSPSEALVISPQYSWQYNPAVTMYAPRGDAIPSWWTGNRPTWCYDVLTWFTAFEAQGNGATNTRVQIANLRFFVLSQATHTWKQYDMKAAPGVDMWQYPFTYSGASSGVRYESSGGISVKPHYPYFHHGYGNSVTINPQDVRAVFVAMDYRLVVDDPSKPDDRAAAKYVVDAGGDYYPGNGQGDWSLGYAPGMGNGRMVLATNSWRNATMLIPNPNYGATMTEMKSNPPPGIDASGTATTTTTAAATTTTTRASTTTTSAATTTTVGSTTTTTLASVSGTTVGGVTASGTTSTPVTTTAYASVTAKNSGKCLDNAASSTVNGTAILQWTCTGNDNQKWDLRDMGGAQYQVQVKNSGKCLNVPGGSTTDGVALQQYDCANVASQLWTRRATASGYSQLVSVASGKCLNVQGYSSSDGAPIVQSTCTNSDSQLWSLPISKPQAMVAKVSSDCMDVSGWSTANGTVMQQWGCNGGTNQQWTYKNVGNARYEVVSTSSGKCVEVQNGSTSNGAPVQQSDCTGATKQLWTFRNDGSGYNRLVSVVSGKCMDVTGWSTANGAKIQQWDCGPGGDEQRWMIK
jgi:hypothetical protein